MAEPGWPLIPREVLPAPIPAAHIAHRRPVPHAADPRLAGVRQLSIFGAETIEPSPADLAGLLAGPGHLGRMGGTARVAVRVDAAWRVHVLVDELVSRGLVVSWHPIDDTPPAVVRRDRAEAVGPKADPSDDTAHQAPESDTGADWDTTDDGGPADPDGETAGGVIGRRRPDEAEWDDGHGARVVVGRSPDEAERDSEPGLGQGGGDAGTDESVAEGDAGDNGVGDPPGAGVAGFEVRTAYSSRLNGLARGWPAAAHQLFLSGPRLRLWVAAAGAPRDAGYALGLDPGKDPTIVDAALVRAGLAGTVSEDGRDYLILGRKRLARLAELVGQRPRAAPPALWPGGVAA